MAAGSITSKKISPRRAPRLCADHTRCRSTPRVPASAAAITVNTVENAVITIFDRSNTPNHSMKIGRNASVGVGKPTDTIGVTNQPTSRWREIMIPTGMPIAQASAKPASARYSVVAALMAKPPDARSLPSCATTAGNGGSRNGRTSPSCPTTAQAASTATTPLARNAAPRSRGHGIVHLACPATRTRIASLLMRATAASARTRPRNRDRRKSPARSR